MFVGVQPFCILNNEIMFLIGQEKEEIGYKDSLKWSGFGGLKNNNESYLRGAIRECSEEIMGIFSEIEIKKRIINRPVYYRNSCIYFMKVDFNKNLPLLFDNFYKYVKKAININIANDGFFEKCKIMWIKKSNLLELDNNDIILRKDYKKSLKVLCKELNSIIL